MFRRHSGMHSGMKSNARSKSNASEFKPPSWKKGFFMEYISVKQAADKWDTSVQIVRRFCRQERINGAIQSNGSWMIPANARKSKRIEGIDPDVEKLPPLVRSLIRQKKKKNFHGLYDYVQTDFTYSSCRMASNRLTRGQVETIFKKGKVSVSFEPMKENFF